MAVPKRTSKSKQINENSLEKNRFETISQSLFTIFNCGKRKLQMETADVSLDQNPQGIHLERITFIFNHTKAV
jgi:hypothetical protein